MAIFEEQAAAKVNLTLEILGRRLDGYHELLSLVAFASAGDLLRLDTGAPHAVSVSGRFGAEIAGPNILARTLDLVAAEAPALKLGAVHLEKRLPVAAGLGGGSANAAALLRAIQRANPDQVQAVDWLKLAVRLGADVPVCLANRPAWMRGIGDQVMPLVAPLPRLDLVLVNPLAQVPADKTAQVFRRLAAGPLDPSRGGAEAASCASREALLSLMRERGNDLARPGSQVVPAMTEVLAALASLASCELAAVSGAGPSCFGVFADAAAAEAAARGLKAAHPGWWVQAAFV